MSSLSLGCWRKVQRYSVSSYSLLEKILELSQRESHVKGKVPRSPEKSEWGIPLSFMAVEEKCQGPNLFSDILSGKQGVWVTFHTTSKVRAKAPCRLEAGVAPVRCAGPGHKR
jgi:hypothetical protein